MPTEQQKPPIDILGHVLRLLDVKTYGLDNLETVLHRPSIYAMAPHTGHGDILIVRHTLSRAGVPNMVLPVGKDYWFPDKKPQNLKEQFEHAARAAIVPYLGELYPVVRGSLNLETIQAVQNDFLRMLADGKNIVIAPEGTRSNQPFEKRKFKKTFAQVALMAGAPVVPVLIHGYDDVFPKGTFPPHPFGDKPQPHRKVISVVVGQPLIPEPNADPTIQDRTSLTHALFAQMLDMHQQM